MRKLFFFIFAIIGSLAVSAAHADYYPSPFALLYTPNIWSATQTFNNIIINGTCSGPGCGSGGGGQNYPDWIIAGSQTINSPTSNSITVAELNVAGDAYILNLYTDPQ